MVRSPMTAAASSIPRAGSSQRVTPWAQAGIEISGSEPLAYDTAMDRSECDD